MIVAAAMLMLMTASLEGQPGAEGKSPAGKTGTDYDSLSLNMGDTLTCSERISLYREAGNNSDHLTAGGLLRQLISDCLTNPKSFILTLRKCIGNCMNVPENWCMLIQLL